MLLIPVQTHIQPNKPFSARATLILMWSPMVRQLLLQQVTNVSIYFGNINACCVTFTKSKSSFSGLSSSMPSSPIVVEIDISSYLFNEEYQYVKQLVTFAQRKKCYLPHSIQLLAKQILSDQILSSSNLSFLKYELELILDNISETDPQLQNIIFKNFKTFEDEGENQVSELSENRNDVPVTTCPPTPTPTPTSTSQTIHGVAASSSSTTHSSVSSTSPLNQSTTQSQAHHLELNLPQHHVQITQQQSQHKRQQSQHTTPFVQTSNISDTQAHNQEKSDKRSFMFKNLAKGHLQQQQQHHQTLSLTPPPNQPHYVSISSNRLFVFCSV